MWAVLEYLWGAKMTTHLMNLLFDVLMVDEAPLLKVPLSSRLGQLDKVLVYPSRGRCKKVERTEIDFSGYEQAAGRLMRYFTKAVE
jgi:ATP-dependent DNA ligase